jgi:hypothetical protein
LGQAGHIHVVFLGVVIDHQVLHLHLHLNPLLIGQSGPNVVRLSDDGLVWLHYRLRLLDADVQGPHDEHQSRKGSETGDRFEPLIVEIVKHHLRLSCFQDQLSELFNFQ